MLEFEIIQVGSSIQVYGFIQVCGPTRVFHLDLNDLKSFSVEDLALKQWTIDLKSFSAVDLDLRHWTIPISSHQWVSTIVLGYYFVQNWALAIKVAFIDDPVYAADQVVVRDFIVCLSEVSCEAFVPVAKVVADAVRVADLLCWMEHATNFSWSTISRN